MKPAGLQRARSTRPSSQTGSSTRRPSPSAPKTRNRSKPRANQRSCVTASDRAVEGRQALLQRLGRDEVEVVGRLVEQQQRRAGQLEQQDLQPRLLAAGQRLERLLGGVRQLVAVQRPRRLLRGPSRRGARRRASRMSSSVRPTSSGCSWVCANQPGPHPRAEPGPAGVRDRRDPQRRRPAGARRPGRCRRRRAAAGSATCPSRSSRARRPARRTRPRGRTASSAR